MSQSSGSDNSSECLRLSKLEKKFEEQSQMMIQMMELLQKQMEMLNVVVQANSSVKLVEEDTPISSPVKPVEKTQTKVSKTTKKEVSKPSSKQNVAKKENTNQKMNFEPPNDDYSAYGRLCHFYENK
jgi:hypothetical protein